MENKGMSRAIFGFEIMTQKLLIASTLPTQMHHLVPSFVAYLQILLRISARLRNTVGHYSI